MADLTLDFTIDQWLVIVGDAATLAAMAAAVIAIFYARAAVKAAYMAIRLTQAMQEEARLEARLNKLETLAVNIDRGRSDSGEAFRAQKAHTAVLLNSFANELPAVRACAESVAEFSALAPAAIDELQTAIRDTRHKLTQARERAIAD